MFDLSPSSLMQHRQWAASRWVLPLLDRPAVELADIGVMALGLIGEVAEVADVIEEWAATGAADLDHLGKELGDTFYYWSRISARFDLPTSYLEPRPFSSNPQPPVREALRLVRAAGQASEILKKHLRDGHLPVKNLQTAMTAVGVAWLDVCAAAGLHPQKVVQANHDKIEGRVARGTQRGSGNFR